MANAANLVNFGGGTSGLRLLDRRIFTANGTWTKPADNAGNILAGTNKVVRIWLIGGGAGGNSGLRTIGLNSYRAGGGGGGLTEKFIDVSQAPASASVTIGTGGASNANGGNTIFGSLATAGGGTTSSTAIEAIGSGGGGTSPGGSILYSESTSGYLNAPFPAAGGGAGGSYNQTISYSSGGGNGGGGAGGVGNAAAGSAGLDYSPGGGGAGNSGGTGGAGGLYGGGGGGGNAGGAGGAGVAVIEVYG